MGEMEKNAQIGELVKQRQSQRVTLEHLRLKGKKSQPPTVRLVTHNIVGVWMTATSSFGGAFQ